MDANKRCTSASQHVLGMMQTTTHLAPRFILERTGSNLIRQILVTNKLHMLSRHILLTDTCLQKQVSQRHSLPNIGTHTTSSPIETNSLSNHVLLLSAVPSTDESDGQFTWFHGSDFVHAQIERAGDTCSTDTDAMLVPFEIGTSSMVTHVVQARRCDELVLMVNTEGRLDVEGMTSREANQLSITGDPFVRCADITVIGIVLHIPHGGGLGNDIRRRSASILVNHWDGDGRRVWTVELFAGSVGGIFVDLFEVGEGGGWFDECSQIDGRVGDCRAHKNRSHGCSLVEIDNDQVQAAELWEQV